MFRSQSISNIQERSNNFLTSFRSKPKAAATTDTTTGNTPRRHRPLSQSISSINLNQKYTDSLEETSYTSAVRKQRSGTSPDKENFPITSGSIKYKASQLKSNVTANSHSRKSSSVTISSAAAAAASVTTTSNNRTLKTRSSAPNLKSSKRHSIFFGNNVQLNSKRNIMMSPIEGVQSNTTPPIDILADDLMTDKNIPYDEESYTSYEDSNYSPYTPDEYTNNNNNSTLDPLIDSSSILIDTDFKFDYNADGEEFLHEKFAQKQLYNHNYTFSNISAVSTTSSKASKRKTNLFKDINDFVKLLDDNDSTTTSCLPINDIKSLDMERAERNEIRKSLQQSLERETEGDDEYITTLKLVENAVFVGFESKKFGQRDDDESIAAYNGEEYIGILKNEPYEDRSEDFYMKL